MCLTPTQLILYHTDASKLKEASSDSLKNGTPTHASRMLVTIGRKLHTIIGDGNCFFRALSYGTEDHHSSVRASIALFSEINVECFKKYCTTSRVMEHIRCMKQEAVFATQMEAHATASCIQRTVCIFTQKSGNDEYYWESFILSRHALSNYYQSNTEYCCILSWYT